MRWLGGCLAEGLKVKCAIGKTLDEVVKVLRDDLPKRTNLIVTQVAESHLVRHQRDRQPRVLKIKTIRVAEDCGGQDDEPVRMEIAAGHVIGVLFDDVSDGPQPNVRDLSAFRRLEALVEGKHWRGDSESPKPFEIRSGGRLEVDIGPLRNGACKLRRDSQLAAA
jgi:hypothetical protein